MIGKLTILLRRLTFIWPERNEVAVIHVDDFWLRRLILEDIPATTIPIFPEEGRICIHPKILIRIVLRLALILPLRVAMDRQKNRAARRIYEAYLLELLDEIGARVVLTFVDNSLAFQRLSRLDSKRLYLAVQNGTRTLSCVRDSRTVIPASLRTISMTNFYCFGERDIFLFRKHEHQIDNMLPIGSLVGGYYKSMISNGQQPKKYDLCLISQWHSHFFEDDQGRAFPSDSAKRIGRAITALIEFLQRLISETKLSMIVCLRNSDDAGERRYFEARFNGSATITGGTAGRDFSTYRASEESKLTLALNSTVLAEVIAWGEKTLWCNIVEDEHYEMPELGISYFCGRDYDAFRRRVVDLIDMPAETYREMTADAARFINNFDPKTPPHAIIRKALLEALAPSNSNGVESRLVPKATVSGTLGIGQPDRRPS